MLDFTEIPNEGTEFELMIRELLYNKGLEVYWSGKGPDNGRDLIFIENPKSSFKIKKRKWLVQCKHFAGSNKAVGNYEIKDVSNDCNMHGADGFLLACSTYPSAALVTKLEQIELNTGISVVIWDCENLKRELLKPENLSIINTYLPISSKKMGWIINSVEPGFWHAFYKGNIFYISTRLSANVEPILMHIEKRIHEINNIKLPEDCKLRIRSVYFDDKNTNFILYLDLFFLKEDLFEQKNPKELLYKIINTLSEEDRLLLNDNRIIEGIWYDIDLQIYFGNNGDSFDLDHKDYYYDYFSDFRVGSFRKKDRHLLAEVYNKYELTEELINNSYDELIISLKKLDFIKILKAYNSSRIY